MATRYGNAIYMNYKFKFEVKGVSLRILTYKCHKEHAIVNDVEFLVLKIMLSSAKSLAA